MEGGVGGKGDAARAAYQRAAETQPGGVVGLAQVAMASGNTGEARRLCEELVNRTPKSTLAWTMLAAAREAEKAYPEAIQAYQRAIALDKSNALAANNLAWRLATDKGDFDGAVKLAEHAREIDPKNAAYADTAGWIRFKMGDSPTAEKQLDEALRLQPKNATFLYHRGVVLMMTGQDKGALASLQAAVRIDPKLKELQDALNRIDQLKARLESAARKKEAQR